MADFRSSSRRPTSKIFIPKRVCAEVKKAPLKKSCETEPPKSNSARQKLRQNTQKAEIVQPTVQLKGLKRKEKEKPKQPEFKVGQLVKAKWKSSKLPAEIIAKSAKGLKIRYTKDGFERFVQTEEVGKILKA